MRGSYVQEPHPCKNGKSAAPEKPKSNPSLPLKALANREAIVVDKEDPSMADEKIIGTQRCTFCDGKGHKQPSGQTCDVCNGTGQMPIHEKKN
jgi:hypothetical protein